MEYTVKDNRTEGPTAGKEITFDWNGAAAPTETDMQAVFTEAGKHIRGENAGSFLERFADTNPAALLAKTLLNPKLQTAVTKGVVEGAERIGGQIKTVADGFAVNVNPVAGKGLPYDPYAFEHTGEKAKLSFPGKDVGVDTAINDKLAGLHKYLDAYKDNPKGNPEGLIEHLTYGVVEFLPQLPSFQAGGGGRSAGEALVKEAGAAFTAIAKKFGPEIARQVAAVTPSAMTKAGKFSADMVKHAAGEYGAGFTAETFAGRDVKTSHETGEGFAVMSSIMKAFGSAMGGALKWMKTNPDAVKAPEAAPKTERAGQRFHDFPVPEKKKASKDPVSNDPAKMQEIIARYDQEIKKRTEWLSDKEGNQEHAKRLSEQNGREVTVEEIEKKSGEVLKSIIKKRNGLAKKLQARTSQGTVKKPVPRGTAKKTPREVVADEIRSQQDAEAEIAGETQFHAYEPSSREEVAHEGGEEIQGIEGLEPSESAKSIGKLVDRIDKTRAADKEKRINELIEEAKRPIPTRRPVGEDRDRGNTEYLSSVPAISPRAARGSVRENVDPQMERSAAGAWKQFRRKLYEWTTTDSTPIGDRHGVGKEMVGVAAARQAGPHRAAAEVAKTLDFDITLYDREGNVTYEGKAYKSDEFKRTFERTRNYDNILSGHDTAVENTSLFSAKAAQAHTDLAQAEAQLDRIREQSSFASEGEVTTQAKRDLEKKIKRRITGERRNIREFTEKAEKAREAAAKIKKSADDLFTRPEFEHPDGLAIMDNFVREQVNDSQVYEALDRWLSGWENEAGEQQPGMADFLEKQWRQTKRLPDHADSDYSRGRHTGIRAQLHPVDLVELERPLPAGTGQTEKWNDKQWHERNETNRDKWDQRAKFTGTYSTNMEANLGDVIGKRSENVAKADLYDKMIAGGVMTEHGSRPPETIKGEKAVPFTYTYPVSKKVILDTGKEYWKTEQEARIGYIPESLKGELEGVLGMFPKSKQNPIGSFINGTQMFGIMDAVIHGNNVVKTVAKSQGATESSAYELMRRLPFFGKADAMARIGDVYKKVIEDSPEMREKIADLSERGILRTRHHREDIAEWLSEGAGKNAPEAIKQLLSGTEGTLNKVADYLYAVDTASRMILDDAFTQMVRENRFKDTEPNRRHFIEQVGQYNERLMGPIQRTVRNWGIGPFIVAGRTMNRNARRALTGYQGAEAPDMNAEIQNRMVAHFGTAMVALLPAVWNLYYHDDIRGPGGKYNLGEMVLPGKKDEYGNHKVVNVAADSFLQRGMNLFGGDILQSLAAGRHGVETDKKAAEKAFSGRVHPWLGPWVQTGAKSVGLDVGRARLYGHPDDTVVDRTKEVAADLNPLFMSSLSDTPGRGKIEREVTKEGGPGRASRHLDALLNPFVTVAGYKESRGAMSEAEQMTHNAGIGGRGAQMTKKAEKDYQLKNEIHALFQKDEKAALEKMRGAIEKGDLTRTQGINLYKGRKLTKLQHYYHDTGITFDKALDIFDVAKPEERKQIGAYLIMKAVNKMKTSENAGQVAQTFRERTAKYGDEMKQYAKDYEYLEENKELPEINYGD